MRKAIKDLSSKINFTLSNNIGCVVQNLLFKMIVKTHPDTMGKMLGLLIVCHGCRWVQSIPPVFGTDSFWCRGHLFQQSYPYHFFLTHLWAKTLSFITLTLYIDKIFIFIKILKLLLPIFWFRFFFFFDMEPSKTRVCFGY